MSTYYCYRPIPQQKTESNDFFLNRSDSQSKPVGTKSLDLAQGCSFCAAGGGGRDVARITSPRKAASTWPVPALSSLVFFLRMAVLVPLWLLW